MPTRRALPSPPGYKAKTGREIEFHQVNGPSVEERLSTEDHTQEHPGSEEP